MQDATSVGGAIIALPDGMRDHNGQRIEAPLVAASMYQVVA